MVVSSIFALLVTDAVPLRKFVTLLLVPVAAGDTGHTVWVKSGEVTHMGLRMGEPSQRINPNISQLCWGSSHQAIGDGAPKENRKHKRLPSLVLCFDLLREKKKCRKVDQTLLLSFNFIFFFFFSLSPFPSQTCPSNQVDGTELILNISQHTVSFCCNCDAACTFLSAINQKHQMRQWSRLI